MPCLRQPMYLTRVWVFYKSVYLFEKMFQMFLRVVWRCVVFEKKASVFASWSQVTKSFVYPYCTQRFSLCFQPFLTILFHHWIWWTILRLGSLFGTGAGHRMDHECNGAKCLWQFVLKGLWSFRLGNTLRLMIIWFVLPKILDVQAWPILEGNMWDYPRGCKCDCVLISCICLVLGYLAFDFMYM